jgi:hypothetical protein
MVAEHTLEVVPGELFVTSAPSIRHEARFVDEETIERRASPSSGAPPER